MWIIDYFLILAIILVTLLCAIIVHELGHWLVLTLYWQMPINIGYKSDGNKSFFYVGEPWHYEMLTFNELSNVYFWGILSGAIMIVFIAVAAGNLAILMCLLPYSVGCMHDFKQLKRCMRHG